MEIHRVSLRYLLLFLLCSFTFFTARSQQSKYTYTSLPAFANASSGIFVYSIPADSVESIVYRSQQLPAPGNVIFKRPVAFMPYNKKDSVLGSDLLAPGYYMLLSVNQNVVNATIYRKQDFFSKVVHIGDIQVVELRDKDHNIVKDATVDICGRRIPYDEQMRGYILGDDYYGDGILISRGADIEYYKPQYRTERQVVPDRPRYGDDDYGYDSYGYNNYTSFNGYLVTNKPKYLPNDTVKYKAYILDATTGKPYRQPLQVRIMTEDMVYYYMDDMRRKIEAKNKPASKDDEDNGDEEESDSEEEESGNSEYIRIAEALQPAEPGVYYSEFVLGDSVQMDEAYAIVLADKETGVTIRQVFQTEDYVLDELRLKMKVPGSDKAYQKGDSVHIYAYAHNSNNLPVMDGKIKMMVTPAYYSVKDTSVKMPGMLYEKEVDVDPGGETVLSFGTAGFPDFTGNVNVSISLVNANGERKDTAFSIHFTYSPYVIKTSQRGNVITAELFDHGKSINATGWYTKYYDGKTIRISYPYKLIVDGTEEGFTFGADSIHKVPVSAVSAGNADDSLSTSNYFLNDTAYLVVSNPQKVFLRYTVYKGVKYIGHGMVHGDTVLKFYSPDGETVTLFTQHTWKHDIAKRIPIYTYDKAIQAAITKKDYVYPGQTDSIRINLSDVAGKPVQHTNVTVLAFNSQFKENYVPVLPYMGAIRPGVSNVVVPAVEQENFSAQRSVILTDRQWLSKTGLDTSFFYNNILLSLKLTTQIQYPLPVTMLPQVGVHIYKGGGFIRPAVIYIDNRPVYYNQAVSTNPSAFYVTSGKHVVRVRTATGSYDAVITAEPGTKLDLIINVDKLPVAYKTQLPAVLSYEEQNVLAQTLLQYRPQSYRYNGGHYKGLSPTSAIMQQYPLQYKFESSPYNTTVVGPFNFNDSILFYQYHNTKRQFKGEPNYIFDITEGMLRLEKNPVQSVLSRQMYDAAYWPDLSQKAEPLIDLDTFIVREPVTVLKPTYKDGKRVSGYTKVKYIKPAKNADNAVFTGLVLDEKNEPVLGAIVEVLANNIPKGGAATDVDGKFRIKGLQPGKYDVKISATSYVVQLVHNVMIYPNRLTDLYVQLRVNTQELDEVVVTSYQVPLVDKYAPSGSATMTSEQIEKMPTRSTDGVASTVGGVYSDNGNLNFSAARSNAMVYTVDNIQVSAAPAGSLSYAELDDEQSQGNITLPGSNNANTQANAFINQFMSNMMNASGGRKNFRDWAIWEPNLWTDKKGNTSFTVTYPDNMTAWNTYILAMNEYRFSVQSFSLTHAFKPLSAQLSIPRFLLYGDSVTGIGKVLNYTQTGFGLKTVFEQDGKELGRNNMTVNNVKVEQLAITVPASRLADTGSTTLVYGLKADNGYEDGEERAIPIYPVGVVQDKGDFFELPNDSIVYSKPISEKGFTGKAVVQVDGNMLEVMLREIENLKEYPHGCTEQLTTKLLAISYEESVKRILNNEELNNTETKKAIIEKLVAAQNKNGSFGWFSANDADYRITNYVISTMMKVNNDGWLDVVIRRGLDFLKTSLDNMDEYEQVTALATLSSAGYKADYPKYLVRLDTLSLDLYNSFALVNIKREQSIDYRRQLDSLVSKKNLSNTGISWGYTSYDWYRDNLATTLIAYKVIKNDSVYGYLEKPVIRYILSRRKNGYYNNTAESGLVLTTLLPDLLKKAGKAGLSSKVSIGGTLTDTIRSFPKTIKLTDRNMNLSFNKTGASPAYVSVIYKYLDTKPKTDSSSFNVSTLFLSGNDTVTSLTAGDKFVLRTTVKVVKESEYVMVEVPIPAGCIQIKSNNSNSYYRYSGEANRENYKDRTNIFCGKLNPGVYTFDVELEARYKGRFTLNSAKAGMMYQPDEYGNNEPKDVMIK